MKSKPFMILITLLTTFCISQAGTISIEVTPGKNWIHTHRFGLVKLKIIPQMAFWLADSSGSFVTTLYVTSKTGTQSWRGGARLRRPSALPVWSHSRGIQAEDSLYMPTKNNPVSDAVTGATPKAGFTKIIEVPDSVADGIYIVYSEVNSSFDYNNRYDEDTDPDFSGQPSLVWRGVIEIGRDLSDVNLEIVGHGHPQGADGEIYPDLTGFTTALEIIVSISASQEK